MLIFGIGNICNFVAFNFAAQSLLAPLNALSLVVNVFVAPMLNGEIWSWKDIVGIILIITGSTMVVAFAGFPPKDYTICVLLKLFQRPGTIIFLSVTATLIVSILTFILIVEKNLDLKKASAVVVEEAFEGELVSVKANPHHAQFSKTLSIPEITVAKELTAAGQEKIVTVVSPMAIIPLEDENSISDNENDDEEAPTPKPDPDAIEIVGSDTIPLDTFLRRSSQESIHSIELRFKVDEKDQEIKSNDTYSSDGEVEKTNMPRETVVVLPKVASSTKGSKWYAPIKTVLAKLGILKWIRVPQLEKKIPVDSPLVVYGLPLCYASFGVFYN
jgi:hypothetical protein